jgi:hypothetical protein
LIALTQIVFNNRKIGDDGEDCKLTLDGKDFQTTKQGSVKGLWGHKFRSAGLRYEIDVNIKIGWICWIMGPFPCGDWNDFSIFRFCLEELLEEGERVEADDG